MACRLPGFHDNLQSARYVCGGTEEHEGANGPTDEYKPRQVPRWSPFQDHGGTVMAIAGKNFAIVGSDTRMNQNGFEILSREVSKTCTLTDRTVVACGGMQADREYLFKNMGFHLQEYEYRNNKEMAVSAVSSMLSNILYSRRFFPLFCYCLVAGVNPDGEGEVYSYDIFGCTEKLTHCCFGSASRLVEAYLDMRMWRGNQRDQAGERLPFYTDISQDEAAAMVQDALTSACERDFNTGDSGEILVITADGVKRSTFELKKD
eukprot:TRINITY_DN1972_c1_g1_i1.p1 TRINITY_DN1972_c1_g1~~TRINITY_DN1972_c1_g1_i1.p1  ORF type:complete len:293 (+),score=83.46 TRINITY_DN1972_c1_g1_i1:96-881(+)